MKFFNNTVLVSAVILISAFTKSACAFTCINPDTKADVNVYEITLTHGQATVDEYTATIDSSNEEQITNAKLLRSSTSSIKHNGSSTVVGSNRFEISFNYSMLACTGSASGELLNLDNPTKEAKILDCFWDGVSEQIAEKKTPFQGT